MKQLRILWLAMAACMLSAWTYAAETSLTVYNNNFAVVRQTVPLTLKQGVTEVNVSDTSAHVETDSVILRDPSGKHLFQILEQNYRNDPVSQQRLLHLYEGQTIEFVKRFAESEKIIKGKIIRSGYQPHYSAMRQYGNQYYQRQMLMQESTGQPIIEVDGKLQFQLPGMPLFPALADDTILTPTLSWRIDAPAAATFNAEMAYLSGGMNWKADYNIVENNGDGLVDVTGWVTLDNQCGKNFTNAKVKLMAGDVSKLAEDEGRGYDRRMLARAAVSGGRPPVTEKAFDEFHLYTLQRPVTLRDRETKQVEFIRASGVQSKKVFVYDGAQIDRGMRHWNQNNILRNREYGTQCNPKVWVMREIKNSKENHLGIPLPKGRLRFYQKDDDTQLEFVGENEIDHTPKDELVRVYTGNAFDLVGERIQTDYKLNTSRNMLDETFTIKLRNRKEKDAVDIRVVEHLYRWPTNEITDKSHEFRRLDARTIEFPITVPAGKEVVVTYTVHYTW